MSSPGSRDLRTLVKNLTQEQVRELVADLPQPVVVALMDELGISGFASDSLPDSPLEFGKGLIDGFRVRPQLKYLADRLARAVRDVEAGQDRRLILEMPPRSSKTTMATQVTPAWIMARHPSWPIALASHDGQLATSWGRQIRRWVDAGALGEDVRIAPDAGAASSWETTAGGKLLAVSLRESFTGRGAKVLIIDDPHKDFVDAHSAVMRKNVWDWWLSVAQTRLEPPSLVIVAMTRWHDDDFVARLLSSNYEGDPGVWERIHLPALAEAGDLLGRSPGEPMISPLLEESVAEATARLESVRRSVGTYVFSAMYQQRPNPAQGTIFNVGWWRYWTLDPERAAASAATDGKTMLLTPEMLAGGRWIDSWDCTFKKTTDSDFVVGQRWVRIGPYRCLMNQTRDRRTFTATLAEMKEWVKPTSPYGQWTHRRLVEDKANGTAIIDTLQKHIAGIVAVNPTVSKEARARAVTPEIESGHVLLPHPGDPGNDWVPDFIAEHREFPRGTNDDQVDATSQALMDLRDAGQGSIGNPVKAARRIGRTGLDVARATRTDLGRNRAYG